MSVDNEDHYFVETVALVRNASPLEQLRAALATAEELERRGVAWSEAWRNTDTWHRLARITMLLGCAREAAHERLHGDVDQWRARHNRKKNIQIVK